MKHELLSHPLDPNSPKLSKTCPLHLPAPHAQSSHLLRITLITQKRHDALPRVHLSLSSAHTLFSTFPRKERGGRTFLLGLLSNSSESWSLSGSSTSLSFPPEVAGPVPEDLCIRVDRVEVPWTTAFSNVCTSSVNYSQSLIIPFLACHSSRANRCPKAGNEALHPSSLTREPHSREEIVKK